MPITDREVYRQFQILNETSTIGIIDEYVVEGQLKNIGDKDVTFIKIVATFYRADGTIAAFGYTYTDPIDLKVGEVGQFRVTSYPYEVAAGEVVRYSLEFECSNY